MSRRQVPSELSRLLRLGDPAGGEAKLKEAEARVIRSLMLEEVAKAPRRRAWLALPLLGAVATAILLTAGITWWSRVEPVAAPALLADVTALNTAFTRAADLEAFAEVAPQPETAPRRPKRVTRPTPAPPSGIAEARVARTLEFQTQGGTRVVWVLDPDFSLNPTEARTR